MELVDPEGNLVANHRKTVAICRCGRSSIRPLCDGTHKRIGFTAPGRDGRDVVRSGSEVRSEE